MNDTLVLERQKILKYPYTKKVETLQKAYDFLEYLEDIIFVQNDKKNPDTSCVDKATFKKILTKK
jgi:hypothetical protein